MALLMLLATLSFISKNFIRGTNKSMDTNTSKL